MNNGSNESEKKNKKKNSPGEEPTEDQLNFLMKTGGVVSHRAGETIHCLTIVGQIEGHYQLPEGQKATRYEHLIPLLVSIEESDEIDGMLMALNTMGGDVEAGLALAEMVASMKKPTVSLVLGGGHSIGVPLAVSARKSFIVPSATMTIHPVRMSGTVVGVPQTYYYFERMQDRIVDFVIRHSRVEEAYFRQLLMRTDQIATDVGSLIDGQEAVRCGLIGAVGGLSDALGALRKMIRDGHSRQGAGQTDAPPETAAKQSGTGTATGGTGNGDTPAKKPGRKKEQEPSRRS